MKILGIIDEHCPPMMPAKPERTDAARQAGANFQTTAKRYTLTFTLGMNAIGLL